MRMSCIINVNEQKFLVWQTYRKLIVFSLPDLTQIQRYFIEVNFMSCTFQGIVMVVGKNVVKFLKPKISPFRLVEFQQQFIQWEPIGGLCLTHAVVLYVSHSIAFYDRMHSFAKLWAITVVQQIIAIQSSPNEKYLGMRVKECNNIIYMWHVDNLSSRPNQEIIVSQNIAEWQFTKQSTLTILTNKEFRVYLPTSNGSHYLHYCIQLAFNFQLVGFCWMESSHNLNSISHESRRSVDTIATLNSNGQIEVYQLYDLMKRMKSSSFSSIGSIKPHFPIKKIVRGWVSCNKICLLGQKDKNKPFVWGLKQQNNKYIIQTNFQYKPELGQNIISISCIGQFLCVKFQQRTEIHKNSKNNSYQKIKIFNDNKGILTKQLYIEIQGQKWIGHKLRNNQSFEIESKIKQQLILLSQQQNTIYLIGGIKAYKLTDNKLVSIGFIMKNPGAKLIEVNVFTQSLLYKIKQEYMLMEFSCLGDKIVTKIIKSSINKLISLKKGKWAQMKTNEIIVGRQNQIMATFSLNKMYKSLQNQNVNFLYDLYWTTHHGMILIIKNYVFILQLLEGAEGYSLSILKKRHSYLYKRFSAYCDKVQMLNPRQLIFKVKNRVINLQGRLGALISEDPYNLPQTILHSQLSLRKFYPPHHPKMLDALMSCSEFTLCHLIITRAFQCVMEKKTLSDLYHKIGSDFFLSFSSMSIQDQNKLQLELSNNDQLLRKFSNLILEEPQITMLQEKGPLLFQNQIQALIYRIQNSRSMDFYSSTILTQLQTNNYKNTSFNTRQIAFMAHSANKDEAIVFLKPEKIKWDWMKKYSIPLWYFNLATIKTYIQQIAINQFRTEKQPFDCLLWYILAGKKTILITLFKANQHSSKQHAAIFTFLQRDFQLPANISAAVKNAYVLMDKKRYYHALAFFILAGKYQECISICLSRLYDISLAFLICVLFNVEKTKILQFFMEKGDIWAKHLSLFLSQRHIQAYNCLYQQDVSENWELQIVKCGFHPSVIKFAEQLLNSVQIKRQLQQQQISITNSTSDIFDSFYSSIPETKIEQAKEKISLVSKPQIHLQKLVRFYLQLNLPCLAFMVQSQNVEVLRAVKLQEMMLIGTISNGIQEIMEQMKDIIGMLNKEIINQQYDKALKRISKFNEEFVSLFNKISLTQLYPINKQTIGSMLYYCYHGQKIIEKTNKTLIESNNLLSSLKEMCFFGKMLISLELKCYNQIQKIFDFSKNYKLTEQCDWQILKSFYNKIPFHTKSKSHQLMDCFEPSFYKFARKEQEQGTKNLDISLKMELKPAAYLILNYMALNKLTIKANILKDFIISKKLQLKEVIQKWVENSLKDQINKDYNTIILQGVNARLKLGCLSQFFQESFQNVGNYLIKLYQEKEEILNSRILMVEEANKTQREGVEVFKNKQDGVRSFAINKNQGDGMEIVVLFKKTLKKVQILESLAQRNRSQDGLTLIQEDTFYNTPPVSLNIESLLENTHLNSCLQQKITQVIKNRRSYDGIGLIRSSVKRGDNQYFRSADPIPYMDHNQLNSIDCHYYLPLLLIGGKGLIQVVNFSNLKNFNRITCLTMAQIVKVWSYQNRVTALDSAGNLGCYNFDSKYTNNCVYMLKKSNIVDFCLLNPSTIGLLSSNSLQVIDTLLHPKRQNIFKIQFSNQPIAVCALNEMKLAVLRKSQLLIYDVRMDRLMQTKDVEIEGKSLCTNFGDKILVGRADGKVKIFDLKHNIDEVVKVSRSTDKKNSVVESLSIMGNIGLCLTSQGSIVLIDKI